MSYKGVFKPRNPQKYRGDPSKIIYRSNLELRLMNFLDTHSSVISWESEERFVPYRSPKDKKIHRYYPDFVVEFLCADGSVKTQMIEVKSFRETIEPVVKKTQNGRYSRQTLRAILIWGINQAKWKAAREYCQKKDWDFRLITEKELLPNGRF